MDGQHHVKIWMVSTSSKFLKKGLSTAWPVTHMVNRV
jgi:hypothetical protein